MDKCQIFQKDLCLNKVASCELRNDDGTRLTKSMEIGSVTYLVVTMTEAGHRMCT